MSKQSELVALSRTTRLDEVDSAYGSNGLSNRNLIINGAMQVAQRGTSFASAASETYPVDRVRYQKSVTTGVVTHSQDAGLAGVSPKSAKLEVTTAASSTPAAGVFSQFKYAIEGNDIDHIGLGTSDCKELTLSFYAKASTTGTLPMALGNVGGTKTFPMTIDIDTANTWKRYVYKVSAVTDGSWGSGTSSALELRLGFEYGSDYTGGTEDVWQTISGFGSFSPTYTNPLAYTLNATFNITGLQLEVGDTVTPFEHRSYGDELSRCQRYYQKSFPQGTAPVHNSADFIYQQARPYSAGYFAGLGTQFAVEMRTTPSVTMWTGEAGSNTNSGKISYYDGAWKNTDGNIHSGTSSTGFYLDGNATSSMQLVQYNFEADAEL